MANALEIALTTSRSRYRPGERLRLDCVIIEHAGPAGSDQAV